MLQKVVICGVDTSGLPLLSAAEQEELMKRLKAGDEAARERFIVGNMRLVLSLVRRFWAKNANADDVFQAGCVGLIKAIDNFNESFGVRFSTYAVPTVLVLRNSQKECKMSRKQAFWAVIKAFLSKNDKMTADKLQEFMGLMPFVKWTEKSVTDCIEQFMFDYGRVPTATDFDKKGMPSHIVIKSIYKISLHSYLASSFPKYYKPQITYRQAIQKAIDEYDNPEVKEILCKVLKEYPKTKWTKEIINEAIGNFIIENKHVPMFDDFKTNKSLPYIEIFKSKFNITMTQWLSLYFPSEQVTFKKISKKSSSLDDFKSEYARVRPYTEKDFNLKRDRTKISSAEIIIKKNGLSSWEQLLSTCGLKKITVEREKQNFKLTVIII